MEKIRGLKIELGDILRLWVVRYKWFIKGTVKI